MRKNKKKIVNTFQEIFSFFQEIYNNYITQWPLWIQLALVYSILIHIVYFPIYFEYFQQDEWFYLSYFHQFPFTIQGAWGALTAVFFDPEPFSFHLTPLGTFLRWFEFKLFGISYPFFAFLSLLLHMVNSVLVYGFAQRITKNTFVSFFAGFFFALTFSHSQAVTWMAAHIETQTACLFALFSINTFYDFLQYRNQKKYFLSIIFFLFSVLIKETGVFLILFLPILAVIYKSFRFLKNLKLFYLVAIVYLVFRIALPPLIATVTNSKTVAGIAAKNTDIVFSLYYTITFLIKAFSESFFPLNTLKNFSILIADFSYPQYTAQKEVWGTEYLTFIQSAGHDIALYLTGFIVIIICLATFFHFSSKNIYKKGLLVSFLLILLSILPITFLAGWLLSMTTYISTIESRHLYITSVGISVIFGFLFYWIYQIFSKKDIFKISLKYFFVIPLVLWIPVQIIAIAQYPSSDTQVAKDRKMLVNSWLDDNSHLDKKTVFYSESNVALYGFAEYMLPLQNNPAQVIVGVYGLRQKLPEWFYKKEFLYKPLTKEWYEEYDGTGLGYFLKKKHLFQAIREYKLKEENIIAVQYDGQTHTMHSITSAVRAEIYYYLNELKKKKDWKRYEDKKINYSFIYPATYEVRKLFTREEEVISAVEIVDKEIGRQLFTIVVFKKPDGMGVSNFASVLDDGTGIPIGSNYTFEGLTLGPTKESFTSVTVKNDVNDMYFFNTITNSEVKQITISKLQTEEEIRLVSEIMRHMEFNN